MSLTLSLDNALTGLQAAQSNLATLANNISNANTPGYSQEVLNETAIDDGQGGQGVATSVAERLSDPILVANLNTQNTATSAATTLNNYYQEVQNLFGSVGSASSLSDAYSSFTSAMETLAASPEDNVAQENAITAGQTLASQLNTLSAGIQSLRSNADTAIGQSVTQVNTLLNNIASYNAEIARASALGQSTATFEDQRGQAVQQLAQQMNVQTYTNANDSMVVTTSTGQTLVSGNFAEQLNFSPTGAVNAGDSLAAGTISGISINGLDITSDITGGNVGALLQMRDQQLPALTSELNQFTNQLYNTGQVQTAQTQTFTGATAAGDQLTGTIDGVNFTTAALPANATSSQIATAIQTAIQPPNGPFPNISVVSTGTNSFQIVDAAGNPISSTVSMMSGGTGTELFAASQASNPATSLPVMSTQTHTMSGATAAGDQVSATIDGVTVTTAALPANATTAQIAAALQAALPASLSTIQVTAPAVGTTPSPNLVQITDTAGNPLSSSVSMVNGGTGTETFAASAPSNPLPNTSNHFFSGVNVASGVDNASTIEVDPSLAANPGLLDGAAGVSTPSIAQGLANSFAQSAPVFAAAGNFASPLTMTLSQYASQILGQTSTAAANAQDNSQFQTGLLQSVTTQAQAVSGVSMDQQLANLTVYQNAYDASARVIQTVTTMFNSLLQIQF